MESGGPFADNAIAMPDGVLGATIKSSRPNSRNVRACSKANASSCQYLGNSTNVPVGLHVAKKSMPSNSIHNDLFFIYDLKKNLDTTRLFSAILHRVYTAVANQAYLLLLRQKDTDEVFHALRWQEYSAEDY